MSEPQCCVTSWRLPPCRHRAGKGTHSHWLSILLPAICSSTAGTGGWSWLRGSFPWLGSTRPVSFPSTPQARHSSACLGGVKPHKPPAPFRRSSVGGMAGVLLRNAYVCKVLGCWGGSWGVSSQEREVFWIWDHWGKRWGPKGKPALFCATPGPCAAGQASTGLVGWQDGCQPHTTALPGAVSPVENSGLSPQEGPQLSCSEGSIPGLSPGGQQIPPASSCLGDLLLLLPHISQIPESSPSPERDLFPLLPAFLECEKSLEAPFRVPPTCIPLAVPRAGSGLAPHEHNNKKCVGTVGKERCSGMVCSPDSTGSALKGNFIL